jgi:hypothetical protein
MCGRYRRTTSEETAAASDRPGELEPAPIVIPGQAGKSDLPSVPRGESFGCSGQTLSWSDFMRG